MWLDCETNYSLADYHTGERANDAGLIGGEWGNKHARKKEPRQVDGTALAERWTKLL